MIWVGYMCDMVYDWPYESVVVVSVCGGIVGLTWCRSDDLIGDDLGCCLGVAGLGDSYSPEWKIKG